jgi:hypothetical protein
VRDPEFFRSTAVVRIPAGSFVVVAPYPSPPNVFTMRWQESSGFRFRMAGGYALVPGDAGKPSFAAPRSPIGEVLGELQYGVPLADVHRDAIGAMRREMVAQRASSVIVGPMDHRDAVLSLFSRLLGTGPQSVGGVELWTGVPALLGGHANAPGVSRRRNPTSTVPVTTNSTPPSNSRVGAVRFANEPGG